MRRGALRTLLTSVCLTLFLAGCGPPWTVLKKSNPPDGLEGVDLIGVKFDYSKISLGGKSEEAFLADQPEEDKKAYREVKEVMNNAFLQHLSQHLTGTADVRAAQGNEPVTLHVKWTYLVMGKYAVVYAQDTQVKAHLVFQRDGEDVEDLLIQTAAQATSSQPSIKQRVRIAADYIARPTAKFVKKAQK